jgi:excinuclease ABC subunit B
MISSETGKAGKAEKVAKAKKTKKPAFVAAPTIIDETRDVVVSEAVVRPTGLLDPEIVIVPCEHQVEDAINRIQERVAKGDRVLITTLTKKFAEDLDIYLKGLNIKCAYIHSDVDTIKRIDILSDLRNGIYDVLIGINLLREGLDLPEVSLVCIFDADKEGFLRSTSALIQIVGRAARNVDGLVVMYADNVTRSMQGCLDDNSYKRFVQDAYNKDNGITPTSTKRKKDNILDQAEEKSLLPDKKTRFEKDAAKLEEKLALAREKQEAFTVESRFAQKGKKGQTYKASMKAAGVENNFELIKDTKKLELRAMKLSGPELEIKLDMAIAEMDFELAAAIRDLINE